MFTDIDRKKIQKRNFQKIWGFLFCYLYRIKTTMKWE